MHISDFLFTSNYDPLIQNNLGFINLEKKKPQLYIINIIWGLLSGAQQLSCLSMIIIIT